ncbi:MAG: tRNA (guanosine(37)-N1)-methyltransferase TrmD [Verrucomicrobiota bacterium]|nr:tRNA (guanosine(37)-N1)-methyltransferase TrmD [Verrucomicrobiota bacterium]|tara:strand:+ start:172 stop:876 length:705 start_codon:yes stop_codon:yes gene_type:complete
MIRMKNSVLRFDVLSLFPKTIEGFTEESILGKAIERGFLEINSIDLRRWSKGKHREADDRPFGGGAGMVLKPEPLFDAIEEISHESTTVIYMAPDGEPLSTPLARELSMSQHLLLISGHYEGIDQRVRDELVDREISIGDYVLTNGALPATVLIDAVSRQVPGVLGDEESLTDESFENNLLAHPQYTRPAEYRGIKVPEVLLSGNHQEISKWRQEKRVERTASLRPDLLKATKN